MEPGRLVSERRRHIVTGNCSAELEVCPAAYRWMSICCYPPFVGEAFTSPDGSTRILTTNNTVTGRSDTNSAVDGVSTASGVITGVHRYISPRLYNGGPTARRDRLALVRALDRRGNNERDEACQDRKLGIDQAPNEPAAAVNPVVGATDRCALRDHCDKGHTDREKIDGKQPHEIAKTQVLK